MHGLKYSQVDLLVLQYMMTSLMEYQNINNYQNSKSLSRVDSFFIDKVLYIENSINQSSTWSFLTNMYEGNFLTHFNTNHTRTKYLILQKKAQLASVKIFCNKTMKLSTGVCCIVMNIAWTSRDEKIFKLHQKKDFFYLWKDLLTKPINLSPGVWLFW